MIIHFLLILIDKDLSLDGMFPMINDQNLIYRDLLTIHKDEFDDGKPFVN